MKEEEASFIILETDHKLAKDFTDFCSHGGLSLEDGLRHLLWCAIHNGYTLPAPKAGKPICSTSLGEFQQK